MAMSRRFTDLWVLGAVLAYLLVCWLVVGPGGAGTSTSLVVAGIGLADLPPIALALGVFAVALRCHWHGPLRKLLVLLTGAVALNLLSTLWFCVPTLNHWGRSGGVPMGDLFLIALELCLVTALFVERRRRSARNLPIVSVDLLVASGVFALLVWYYLIAPGAHFGGQGLQWNAVTEVLYPACDMALLLAVIASLLQFGQQAASPARYGTVLAALLLFLCDAVFGVHLYIAPLPHLELVVSILQELVVVALLYAGLQYLRPEQAQSPRSAAIRQADPLLSPLSGVSAAILFVLLLREHSSRLFDRDSMLTAGAALLALLILLRQFLSARRNERWLQRHQRQLEDQVQARTAELSAANAALSTMARQDVLTGLCNRRGFEEQFDLAWVACRASGQPLSVLLIDVDQFKAYNDRYGHPAGDACLRRVAATLLATSRGPLDTLARFGGEEFVLLLPQTLPEEALVLARRILAAMGHVALPHAASSVAPFVTVSIGVAGCVPPADERGQAELLAEADRALYRAKALGRNRVVP